MKKENLDKILKINAIGIVLSVIPLLGFLVVPALFVLNLILAIAYRKNTELWLGFMIFAFLAPLIGTSVCSVIYGTNFFNWWKGDMRLW